jgi:hypothetical protein
MWSSVITWVMSEFSTSDVATCFKHSQIFIIASTCDNNMTRQVSSNSNFVWILYNLKTLFAHVTRHVTTPTWS